MLKLAQSLISCNLFLIFPSLKAPFTIRHALISSCNTSLFSTNLIQDLLCRPFTLPILPSQITPSNPPPASPAYPPRLPRPADEADNQRGAGEAHDGRTAPHPATSGVQRVPHGGAHELAAEDGEHEGRVHAVAGLGLDGEDRRAVGDLRCLLAEVERDGLDDGPGDRGAADEGADQRADQDVAQAEDDAVEGREAVDDVAGVEGPEEHGADADEGE